MNRARALAAVLFGIGWVIPATAQAQNLEAGKSPPQLFANTCAVCHKSARGLVRTVPPGSLPSFLREHYTTSREMAQQLSGYLIASGGTDTRGRPQEARQAPAGAEPAPPPSAQQTQQQARQPQPEPPQTQRPPRTVNEPAAPPLELPAAKRAREAEERRQARREQRAKQAQEAAAERDRSRRGRITPARIDAAAGARGREALPLGDIVKPEPANAKENTAPPPAAESKPAPAPSDAATRPDPVPQVTPAPQTPEPVKENTSPEPPVPVDQPADSGGTAPVETPSTPPSGGPPPVPPISN